MIMNWIILLCSLLIVFLIVKVYIFGRKQKIYEDLFRNLSSLIIQMMELHTATSKKIKEFETLTGELVEFQGNMTEFVLMVSDFMQGFKSENDGNIVDLSKKDDDKQKLN